MKQLNGNIKVKQRYQAGMTLLEITVVLLILIALAGLAMPYIGGTSRKAFCDATDISMANIKRAIMDRYYLDTLGKFPQDLSGLTPDGTPEYNLHFLFSQRSLGADGIPNNSDDRIHKSFDPETATGWRQGGYLQNGIALSSDITTGNFDNSTYTDPFKSNHIVVNDGWGRPIVLQVPTSSSCDALTGLTGSANGYCARLVSAGPGSGLGIGNGDIDTPINDDARTAGVEENRRQADDRILYLQQTPAGEQNIPCGDL